MTHNVDVHVHDPDPPPPDSAWTQERIDLLVEYRGQRMNRGDIAIRINNATGSNFTRAAVCGKIDRIFPAAKPRLTEEEKAAGARASMERWNAKRREATRQKRIALGFDPEVRIGTPRTVQQPFAVVISQPEDFPEARVHGVANLEPHHCRWIFGEDVAEPAFCGLPHMDGSSYCSHHHRVVYVPLQQRRMAQ